MDSDDCDADELRALEQAERAFEAQQRTETGPRQASFPTTLGVQRVDEPRPEESRQSSDIRRNGSVRQFFSNPNAMPSSPSMLARLRENASGHHQRHANSHLHAQPPHTMTPPAFPEQNAAAGVNSNSPFRHFALGADSRSNSGRGGASGQQMNAQFNPRVDHHAGGVGSAGCYSNARSSGGTLLKTLYTATVQLAEISKLQVKLSGYHEELMSLFDGIRGGRMERKRLAFVFDVGSYEEVVKAIQNSKQKLERVELKLYDLDVVAQKILKAQCGTADDSDRYSTLPESLETRLLPFQRDGIKFILKRGGRALLGDEMGLGKTVQALGVAQCYKDEWPVLVVTPSSLRDQWAESISQWLGLKRNEVEVASSSGLPSLNGISFFIASYDYVSKQSNDLRGKFGMVVLDESHSIKSPKTVRSKACVPLVQKCKRALLLSGTPALSRPFELFQQIKAVMPKAKISQDEYCDRYCAGDYFVKTKGSKNEEELNFLLCSTIMIRRLKKDVMSHLKNKLRQQVYLSLGPAEESKLKEVKKRLDDIGNMESAMSMSQGQREKHKALNQFFHETAKAKIKSVQEYVKDLVEQDQKLLIFAHHMEVLDGIEKALNQKKVKYIRIDGATAATKRDELKNDFQEKANVKVAILAIKAAGVGLNFTAANLVIFAELSWVPGDIKQCEDRAHRIGQENDVVIRFLLARNSIDDMIWRTLQNKLGNVGQVLDGGHEVLSVERRSVMSPGQSSLRGYLGSQGTPLSNKKRGSETVPGSESDRKKRSRKGGMEAFLTPIKKTETGKQIDGGE
ncbi:hypothetical protein BSKO_10313 [Bryopsis sp. KO-2023]|nr:hypothetical protein BSKO_10313 [Bryopsis sp. KO-2023]